MKTGSLLLALSLTTLSAAGQLQVHYGTKDLTISGASPRGAVAAIGIIHSNYGGHELIQKTESIEHADAAGQVTMTVSRPSFRSVWLVADLQTGEFVVSSPPGYQLHRLPVPSDGIDQAGRSLLHARSSVDMYVIRRGLGAWHARAAETGRRSTEDASIAVDVALLTAVGSTPPAPAILLPGDIVMIFDAPFMEFWVTKLTAADLKAAP